MTIKKTVTLTRTSKAKVFVFCHVVASKTLAKSPVYPCYAGDPLWLLDALSPGQ